MRLEFFVAAESISVDRVTNELSVFNVLEDFATSGFPLILAKCAVVSLWRLEPEDANRDWQTIIRLTLPGKEPQDFPTNFRTREGARRHRVTQRLYGVPIAAEGDIRFELLLNGAHVAEHVATVRPKDSGASLAEPSSD